MPATGDPRRPRDQVVAAVVAYVAFARAEPGLLRLMTGLPVRVAAGPDPYHPGAAAYAGFSALVARAMGAVPPEAAFRATLGLWAVAHGLADLTVSGQIAAADLSEAAVADILRAAVRGVLAG
jgi:hypothetical protein